MHVSNRWAWNIPYESVSWSVFHALMVAFVQSLTMAVFMYNCYHQLPGVMVEGVRIFVDLQAILFIIAIFIVGAFDIGGL